MKSNPYLRHRAVFLLSEVLVIHDMGTNEEYQYFCQRAKGMIILTQALFSLPGEKSNPPSQRVLGAYQYIWTQDSRILPSEILRRTTLLVHQFSHPLYWKFLFRHHFCLILQYHK